MYEKKFILGRKWMIAVKLTVRVQCVPTATCVYTFEYSMYIVYGGVEPPILPLLLWSSLLNGWLDPLTFCQWYMSICRFLFSYIAQRPNLHRFLCIFPEYSVIDCLISTLVCPHTHTLLYLFPCLVIAACGASSTLLSLQV